MAFLTEAEAERCWCPFVRPVVLGQAPSPQLGNTRADIVSADGKAGAYNSTCIASRCMAWRWREAPHVHPRTVGWCGLAGHPSAVAVVNMRLEGETRHG